MQTPRIMTLGCSKSASPNQNHIIARPRIFSRRTSVFADIVTFTSSLTSFLSFPSISFPFTSFHILSFHFLSFPFNSIDFLSFRFSSLKVRAFPFCTPRSKWCSYELISSTYAPETLCSYLKLIDFPVTLCKSNLSRSWWEAHLEHLYLELLGFPCCWLLSFPTIPFPLSFHFLSFRFLSFHFISFHSFHVRFLSCPFMSFHFLSFILSFPFTVNISIYFDSFRFIFFSFHFLFFSCIHFPSCPCISFLYPLF